MPDMEATVRIRADGSGLVAESQRSQGELDKLGDAAQRSGQKAQSAGRGLTGMGQATREAGREFERGSVVAREFERRTTAAGLAANRATGRIGRIGPAVQQVGYQVGDFAVQVAGGTNAIVAFGQQGGQLLGFFGPFGALAGAAVSIVAALALAFRDTGKAAKTAGDAVVTYAEALNKAKDLTEGATDRSKRHAAALREEALANLRLIEKEKEAQALTAQNAFFRASGTLSRLKDALDAGKPVSEGYLKALDTVQKLTELRNKANAELAEVQEQIKKLEAGETGKALDEGTKAAERFTDQLDRLRGSLDPAGAQLREFAAAHALLEQGLASGDLDLAGYVRLKELLREAEAAAIAAQPHIKAWADEAKLLAEEQYNLAAALSRVRTANDNAQRSFDKAIDGLSEERRLAGLSERDRQVEIRTRQILNKLKAEGVVLTEAQADQLRREVEATVDTVDALEQRARAEEEARRRAEEAIRHSTDRVVDFAADAFDRILDRSSNTWRDIADDILATMRRTFAQLAAEAIVRPIVQPIIQGAVGGLTGGLASGVTGGIGSGIGQSLLSSATSSALGTAGIGGSLFGTAVGGGSLSSVGSLSALAAATGPELAAGGTAGLLGTGGSFLGLGAVGGPLALGALAIGGLALASGFLGDDGVGPNAGARVGFDAQGRPFLSAANADNGGSTGQVVSEAQKAIAALRQIQSITGGRYDASGTGISLAIRSFENQGGLQNSAGQLVDDILRSGSLRGVAQETIDDILAQGIDRFISAADDTANAATQLATAFEQAGQALLDTALDLRFAQSSPLTAQQQFDLARSEFDSLAAGIDSATPEQLTDLGAAARRLQDESAAFNGFTAAHEIIVNSIQAVLSRAQESAARLAAEQVELAANPVGAADPAATDNMAAQLERIANATESQVELSEQAVYRPAVNDFGP